MSFFFREVITMKCVRSYAGTANVRGAKKQPIFIRSCVELFAGEKANP